MLISGIVKRNDSLDKKVMEVNEWIKSKCIINDLTFCDNSNISKRYHTNGSGLYLNYKGTVTLAKIFLRCLKKWIHGCVCTPGYPLSNKNGTEHGASDSEKTDMPNIPIKGNYLNINEDLPELHEKPISILQKMRCKNIGKIIIGHLNVNFQNNKFDAL